jgi:alanine dehydrogenase
MTDVLYLSGRDLAGLAEPGEFVEAVREGFNYRGAGAPAMAPARIRGEETTTTTYTVEFPEWGIKGGYMYSVGDDVWYTTPLFDVETGELLAILDGAVWNPYKTAAVGAVATDELAHEDANSVGVIGSGGIAKATVELVDVVRDIDSVEVFSPTPSSRESFAEEVASELGVDTTAVSSSDEAVDGTDIIVVGTSASEPVIDGSAVSEHAHINAMGAAHPKRELDVGTFQKVTKYVPDIRERVLGTSTQTRFRSARGFLEAYDQGVVSDATLHGELGDIVAGSIPGRTPEDDVTVADSVGTAIETVAAAVMLYRKALERDLGTSIEFIPRHESESLR